MFRHTHFIKPSNHGMSKCLRDPQITTPGRTCWTRWTSKEGENYTPPRECPAQKCRDNKQSGRGGKSRAMSGLTILQ